MIQPLPLDGCAGPRPALPFDTNMADLFAAILAVQSTLPVPAGPSPDAAPALPVGDADAVQQTKWPLSPDKTIPAFERWPESDSVSRDLGRLEAPRVPSSTERSDLLHVDVRQAGDAKSARMRTFEFLVLPETLNSKQPVDLTTELHLSGKSQRIPADGEAAHPDLRNLSEIARQKVEWPTPDQSTSARMASLRTAEIGLTERSVRQAEQSTPVAEPVEVPGRRPVTGRARIGRTSAHESTRQAAAVPRPERISRSQGRPLGIAHDFDQPAIVRPTHPTPSETVSVNTATDHPDSVPPVIPPPRDLSVATTQDRPVLVEGSHEGTVVRFVLEDWTSGAPVRSIRIALEPRDLGTLNITLQHRQGQVHARMLVDNPQSLQLVLAQATALQRALADQGLNFGTFSVTCASNAAWTGLPVGSALRATADPERKEDSVPRRTRRDEVKTT